MDFFDSTSSNYFALVPIGTIVSGTVDVISATNLFEIPSSLISTPDKDWMPYRHFEYDPLWHKKFARIKIQMETMWE